LEEIDPPNIYYIAPSFGFIRSSNGQISFVTQKTATTLQNPSEGKAFNLLCPQGLEKAFKISPPCFGLIPQQQELTSPDFQSYFEDFHSCFKTEALYIISKMAQACGAELQQDYKCTSLLYCGEAGCGKNARQETIASAYCLPIESILAGSSTTSSLTSDSCAYSGMVRLFSVHENFIFRSIDT
jgi:hypothetical protein